MAKLWNLILKMRDRIVPVFQLWRRVVEKPFQDLNEDDRFGDDFIENDPAVLPENRSLRRLKNGVVLWIAGGEFLLYFFGEIVVTVFGFPETVCEAVLVHKRPVDAQRVRAISLDWPLGNELPTKLSSAMLQEILKRGTHRALV